MFTGLKIYIIDAWSAPIDVLTTKTNESSKNNGKSDSIVRDTSARWKYDVIFYEFCMNFITIGLWILSRLHNMLTFLFMLSGYISLEL